MKGLRWLLVMSALAVAGCDGGPKSPDFESVTEVTAVTILDASGNTFPTTPNLPVGTELQLTAEATIVRTVPPGYELEAGEIPATLNGREAVSKIEDVSPAWNISPSSRATITDAGLVKGVAIGAVEVTATFGGKSDTQAVQVTNATLADGAVLCVRPATTASPIPACAAEPASYSALLGAKVPFEAIGRFSDGQVYRISTPPYGLNWTSSLPSIASNAAASSNEFTTNALGSTLITGTVVSGASPLPDPASKSATLNVTAANEFCETEFPADSEIDTETCIGCSVDDDDDASRITDGDLNTFATLNIPLGLLTLSNVSVTVISPTQIPAGRPVGFLLSRTSNNVLAAQLLGSLEVITLRREGENLVEIADPATNSELLRLTLLGIRLPDAPQFLLSTGNTTQAFDAVKLTFRGGLLSLLAAVNVNTACSRAQAPTP